MEITRRLQALDELICNNFQAPDIDQVLTEFDDLKTELQTIYTKKGNAAIFRSNCRWVEKGERPTKYFFNLGRRNYNKKTISELRMENETIIKNETQVLDTIEKYLKDLYTSGCSVTQEEYDSFDQKLRLPKLSDEERDEIFVKSHGSKLGTCLNTENN